MSGDDKRQGNKRRLLKATLSMSGVTLLSRILGLVREQVRAHYLGTSFASDAFGIAFQIPNLLRRMMAEGAMSAAFVPVLSETREKEGDLEAFTFAQQFYSFSIWFLCGVAGFGVLFAGGIVTCFAWFSNTEIRLEAFELTTELTRLMFPYLAFVGWAALAQGILNTFHVFWVSAFTAVLLNLSIIGCAVAFASIFTQPAYGFAIGVLLGGVVQIGFQLPYLREVGFHWRFDFRLSEKVKRALKLLVPTLFGAGVYQVNVFVSQAIAWGAGDGAVSSLQFSNRLLELTLGVFVVALSTAILPTISKYVAAGKNEELIETIQYGVRLTIFVCLPVTAGLYLVRTETVHLLFERGTFNALSTEMTAGALELHILGLVFIALSRVWISVFYAHQDTWRPFWAGFFSMIVNIAGCYLWVDSMGHRGIALANTLAALGHTAALWIWLRHYQLGAITGETWMAVFKTLIATGFMAVVVWGLRGVVMPEVGLESSSVVGYSILVLAGGLVFVGVSAVMRSRELRELLYFVHRKKA